MNRTVKFAALALLVSTAIFAVSCGGNASKKQSEEPVTETATETKAEAANSGAVALKDVSADNWQAAVKSNFGVEVTVPQGWSFKSVRSPNGQTNLMLLLTTGDGTTAEAEGRRLFEATKALSPHGNYKGTPDWENDKVSAGDAVADFADVNAGGTGWISAQWNFTYNSKMIMVAYMARGNEAEYLFTVNNR
jgi:hypothetical protein